MRARAAAGLALLFPAIAGGCAVVNAPLLAIHGVAGMHHKTRAVDVAPFYTGEGRLGYSLAGVLWVEPEPGAAPLRIDYPSTGSDWLKVDDPALAPDGRRIWFISGAEQITSGGAHNDHVWQLYSMRTDGTDLRRESTSRRKEEWPAISPDGTRLAYARRTEFHPYTMDGPAWGKADVILRDLEDGEEHSLTGPAFAAWRGMSFAPDGSAVAFSAAVDEDGPFDLWWLDVEAREASAEVRVSGASYPAFCAADGSLFYVAARGEEGRCDVWRLAPGAETGEPLGLDLGRVTRLACSPDGSRVAWTELVGGRRGDYVLYELERESGAVREVARVQARDPVLFKPFDYVGPIHF